MEPSRILFFSIIPKHSRDQLSIMKALSKQGKKVYFLNRCESSEFRELMSEAGIVYFEINGGHFYSWLYLIRLCFKERIDILFSHLEPANFVAVAAQFFICAKVVVFRHHIDAAKLDGFDKSFTYRFTYFFAKHIVVFSKRAKEYMVEYEKVNPEKIKHINLVFDSSLYPSVDKVQSEKIRYEYSSQILLITIGRLTEYKRINLCFRVIKKLVESGVDAKLLILGEGELKNQYLNWIKRKGLENHIFLIGQVSNVLDFLYAADFLLHPSISESSCVVIKEAALMKKVVFVCDGVGDFNEYIVDEKNGFLVNKDKYVDEAFVRIINNYKKTELLQNMGSMLKESVLENFEITRVVKHYDILIPH